MMKHIDKIRARPVHERKRIAFMLSFGTTVIIFIFWAASFNSTTNSSNVASGSFISPFESVKNSVASAYDSIKRTSEILNQHVNKNEEHIEITSGDSSQ